MSVPFAGKIPSEIVADYNAIKGALGDLLSTWRMYKELFGNSDYQAIIDEHAALPFNFIHRALRSDILMAFGRLLDRAELNGDKNLSLSLLVGLLRPHCETTFLTRLDTMLNTAKEHFKPLRTWRHKVFAHADRDHAAAFGNAKLPNVDEKHIEEGMKMLESILKEVFVYFNGTEIEFRIPILRDGAHELMSLVKDGVKFRKAEIKSLLT
jgi:hypothetical protein